MGENNQDVQEYIDFAEEVIAYINQSLCGTDVLHCSDKNAYILAGFLKAYDLFRSVTVLCKNGLYVDAYSLLRSIYEIYFIAAAMKKDDLYFNKFLENEKHEFFDLEALLNGKQNKNPYKKTHIKEFANVSGIEKYKWAYKYLCGYVHVNPRQLSNFFSEDVDRVKKIEFVIIESARMIFCYIEIVIDYISCFDKKSLEQMHMKFNIKEKNHARKHKDFYNDKVYC